MDSNRFIILVIAFISLMLSIPKLKKQSSGMIIITILVGYAVTKDPLISVAVGLILGSIFTSLNNTPSIRVEKEYFQSKNDSKGDNEDCLLYTSPSPRDPL